MSQSRQYRDDPQSFKNTGIPRGNVRRYESSDVIRMPDGRAKNQKDEGIETQAQQQLQTLARKQMQTDISLSESLSNRKEFSEGSLYKPASEQLKGYVSLRKYKDITDLDSQIQELRDCGLTEDEIELKLQSDTEEPRKKRKIDVDPLVQESKLKAIEQKLVDKQHQMSKTEIFLAAKKISRHEMDLEMSITHKDKKSKLLSNLVTVQEKQCSDKNDPMNEITSILEEMKQKESKQDVEINVAPETEEIKCLKCTKLQIMEKYGHRTNLKTKTGKNMCIECFRLARNQESNATGTINNSPSSSNDNDVVLGPLQKGKLGPWSRCDNIEPVPEDVILRYKLTLDEIKSIPKFAKYHAGEPSKTLYLKNLSHKGTEEDLVALFNRFEKPNEERIIYKLMSGRMRGQAFVTFCDEGRATQALELVNGYPMKDSPIIVHYGKKK